MTEDFATRVFNLLKKKKELGAKLTKDQLADNLGCSRTMLYNYEQGNPEPGGEILSILGKLEQEAGIEQTSTLHAGKPLMQAAHPDSKGTRMIPVLGWAHAGEAEVYEELPDSWKDWVPTECRDPRAFGVKLEGDSMESDGALSFSDGDLLIAMPSEQPYSGCFVIAKFASDGVTFRRLECAGNAITLMPLNERYDVTKHTAEDFQWMYPVYGRWTQLWKRPMK